MSEEEGFSRIALAFAVIGGFFGVTGVIGAILDAPNIASGLWRGLLGFGLLVAIFFFVKHMEHLEEFFGGKRRCLMVRFGKSVIAPVKRSKAYYLYQRSAGFWLIMRVIITVVLVVVIIYFLVSEFVKGRFWIVWFG